MLRRAATLGAAGALVLAVPADAARVKQPTGEYEGDAGRLTFSVSGRSIQVFAFEVRCRDADGRATSGRMSLNDLRLEKRRGRWRLSTLIYGIITYADGRPDENARVRLTAVFSPSASRVTGRMNVRSPACGTVDPRLWSARRSSIR